ncbi:methylated-DNA--[protein]-cysteine S-methyltransferase [Kangiella marina]|uniref:Methylated-DNA-[protein]-cysteine S-methyltransferase DNA binding domain-containing protein n=1 Tax=Kangiella marina TaxID=1079178 RepID=A0ABP8ILX3_9GAMM
MSERMEHFKKQVYYWVAQIPEGKVTSYGTIAKLAGFPRHARHVSKALGSAPNRKTLPWQRVIGADGKIAFNPDSDHFALQQSLLQQEGVAVLKGKVDLKLYGWKHPLQSDNENESKNNKGIQAEDFFR